MTFAATVCPAATPWGNPQTHQQVLPGIWHVTTASHGGLLLSDERQRAMPEALGHEDGAYEEDIDWAAVYLAFEVEFRMKRAPRVELRVKLAHNTVKAWRPHAYARFTGMAVAAQDSPVLRKIEAFNTAVGEHAVLAAYGDWADWVPAGKVGLYPKRVTGVSHLGFGIYDEGDVVRAHCDAARYDPTQPVTTLDELGAVPC